MLYFSDIYANYINITIYLVHTERVCRQRGENFADVIIDIIFAGKDESQDRCHLSQDPQLSLSVSIRSMKD